MSFKIKYKPKVGPEVDLDFTTIEQTKDGMVLVGVDANDKSYRFIWPTNDGTLVLPPSPV